MSYAYDNGRRRQRLSVGQPGGTSWSQTYAYDAAGRLDALIAPEGTYDYQYHATRRLLVQKLVLPNGASITNGHDGLGRLTHTHLRRSDNTLLNRHDYVYNAGHQRTKQTRTDGDDWPLFYNDGQPNPNSPEHGPAWPLFGDDDHVWTDDMPDMVNDAIDAAANSFCNSGCRNVIIKVEGQDNSYSPHCSQAKLVDCACR